MGDEAIQKNIKWLKHEDVEAIFARNTAPGPWLPAYRRTKSSAERITWFSALVLPSSIPQLLDQPNDWDMRIGEGRPSIWTTYAKGEESQYYTVFGNDKGIEPLVIHRSFHELRPDFVELAQEFRLYHNLYPEPSRKRYLLIDDDGNESEAARYEDNLFEIRTDLVLDFCRAKQMALAIYVDGYRDSEMTLDQLEIKAMHNQRRSADYGYFIAVVSNDNSFTRKYATTGSIVGKKYILPSASSAKELEFIKIYQEFIIDTDSAGKHVRHTCDPEKLANLFGKNSEAADYLTPVFFRPEVLGKYYSDPTKYSVEDGYVRCGGLWGVEIDNDHSDCIAVFLGDLGRDLSESERNYWLSFNIPPVGRTISRSSFKRGFMAEFADPEKPDLIFKHLYKRFNQAFQETKGWNFFLPLHNDDKHFLTGLRLLSKDNQSEFDSQLLALTKVLVDSLNEQEIFKGLNSIAPNDKGITKLEKYFTENGIANFPPHIKFLRVLQDLRSRSAAHRKGSSYDKLIADLQMSDEGQQKVFTKLFNAAVEFIRFLTMSLIPKAVD